MAFLLMVLVVACAFFFVGMLYRDKTFSCIEGAWLRATTSDAQQKWLSENGKNYKTLSEARTAWYATGSEAARNDLEKAEKRYRDFLAGLPKGKTASVEGASSQKHTYDC